MAALTKSGFHRNHYQNEVNLSFTKQNKTKNKIKLSQHYVAAAGERLYEGPGHCKLHNIVDSTNSVRLLSCQSGRNLKLLF